MDRPPLPGSAQEALEAFLGRWVGTTQWAATQWGPARTTAAEMTFSRVAAGFAVTASYCHTEADGNRTEGQGVFTAYPDHPDMLLYFVNSRGLPREPPAQASWLDGILTVDRRSERGTARHTFEVVGNVMTHSAGLRLGAATEFTRFMTSVGQRAPDSGPGSRLKAAEPVPAAPRSEPA
jgi:hypothetical protein